MKNLFLLFIAFLLFQLTSLAQAPDTLWTKTFGGVNHDRGKSVQQTTDGGYIIVGQTQSFGAGNNDIWLIKTNSLGDTLWTKTIGGNQSDGGYSVVTTTDGGYLITGDTESFGAGGRDVWLIKTDSLGNNIWTKTFGGIENDEGRAVLKSSDGCYIIIGNTESYSVGGRDLWFIKTNNIGDTLWTRTFGGIEDDEGTAILETSDSCYVITGMTESYGAGGSDLWLIKTNAYGDTLWTRTFGGIEDDEGSAIQETLDGDYVITGFASHGSGVLEEDVWLIKTDASGNRLWDKTYGGLKREKGHSLQKTVDAGYIITATSGNRFSRDLFIIKTDSSGDTLWTQTYNRGLYDFGNYIQKTSDGGYVIVGATRGVAFDVWLIKLDRDIVGVDNDQKNMPNRYCLLQNYPNPFNPNTIIKYQIPELSFVTLKVYDVLGKEITTLVNEEKLVGTY